MLLPDSPTDVNGTDTELILISLGAMLSPTTLTFSIFALVLGDRPRRTGALFYAGALFATLAVGVLAALVLGDAAAPSSSGSPKQWVGWFDVVAAVLLLAWVARAVRRPPNPAKEQSMVDQMSRVASSPAIAVVGAGAALANPGAFIPLALKAISETNPTLQEYVVDWIGFALVSLLPLGVAVLLLLVAADWAGEALRKVRVWLQRHVRTVAAVIVVLLAVALLRNGIGILT
jgi:hypothetical protein